MYYGLVYISNDGKQLAPARSRGGGDLDVWGTGEAAARVAMARQAGFRIRVRVVSLPSAGPFSYPQMPPELKRINRDR